MPQLVGPSAVNSVATVESRGRVCCQDQQPRHLCTKSKMRHFPGKVSKQSMIARGLGVGIEQQLKRPISDHKGLKNVSKPVQPNYSLYSTDSDADQVPKMHNRLDRCASLLSNILKKDDIVAQTKKSTFKRKNSKKGTPKKKVKIVLPTTGKEKGIIIQGRNKNEPFQSHCLSEFKEQHGFQQPAYNKRLVSSTPISKETEDAIVINDELQLDRDEDLKNEKQQRLQAQISQIDEQQSFLQTQYSQMLRDHFPELNTDSHQHSDNRSYPSAIHESQENCTDDRNKTGPSVFDVLEKTVLRISEKLSLPKDMSGVSMSSQSSVMNLDEKENKLKYKIDIPPSQIDIYHHGLDRDILRDQTNIPQYSKSMSLNKTEISPDYTHTSHYSRSVASNGADTSHYSRSVASNGADTSQQRRAIYTDEKFVSPGKQNLPFELSERPHPIMPHTETDSTVSKMVGQTASPKDCEYAKKTTNKPSSEQISSIKALDKYNDGDDITQKPINTTATNMSPENKQNIRATIFTVQPSTNENTLENPRTVQTEHKKSIIVKPSIDEHLVHRQQGTDSGIGTEVRSLTTGTKNLTNPSARNIEKREISKHKSVHPNCASTQIKALEYIFKELKEILTDERSLEVERLLTEIEYIIGLLPFIINNLSPDLQSEIQFAMQPVRVENSDLRRQLRIANQKTKDLEYTIEKMEEKIQLVEGQSIDQKQLKTLRSQLTLEEKDRQSLTRNIQDVSKVVEELKMENKSLLEKLTAKDKEALAKSHDLQHEKNQLISELQDWKTKAESNQTYVQFTEKEKNILKLSLSQSEQEIARLKALNRDLQESVARLLHDITSKRRQVTFPPGQQHQLRTELGRIRKPSVRTTISKVNEYLDSNHTTRLTNQQIENAEPTNKPYLLQSKFLHPGTTCIPTSKSYHEDCRYNPLKNNESNSELSSITDQSFSTLSTLTCDENEFQLELANLDEDIIKLQEALNAAKRNC